MLRWQMIDLFSSGKVICWRFLHLGAFGIGGGLVLWRRISAACAIAKGKVSLCRLPSAYLF
jgi:hypothetical protein